MSGNIDSEQWQNFNQRLTYWIFKQGFWFQLKYSLFLGGKKPGLMLHFVHLTLRLVIFLIFGGLVWVGVVKFTGEEKFTKLFSDQVEKKFAADEIEIQGVSRERGKFTIFRLAMIADKSSFLRAWSFQIWSVREIFLWILEGLGSRGLLKYLRQISR